MTATEYFANLDAIFEHIPQLQLLWPINLEHKYVEEWRLELISGMVAHIVTFQILPPQQNLGSRPESVIEDEGF